MPGFFACKCSPLSCYNDSYTGAWLTECAYHNGCKAPVLKCRRVVTMRRHPLPSVPRALASAAWQPAGPRQPTCDPYAGDHALAEGGGSGDSATPPSLILEPLRVARVLCEYVCVSRQQVPPVRVQAGCLCV